MKKTVAISEFVDALLKRIDNAKDINCCKEDLKIFCDHVVQKIGDDKIEVSWKEP
ncbi:MAG: hypothetical protein JXX14_15850 [Deltaproteobacteria bacterium]|nr:hypothetical protein [Deltaproteobacteria bacterium]